MKVVCIYHSVDLDGWMSAAIVRLAHTGDIPKNLLHTDINFIGYNYGDPIPDLSEYERVILTDISFSALTMLKLNEELGPDFVWLDHHISAIRDVENAHENFILPNGLRDDKFAACELTWKWFFPNQPMPEIVRLLGRYDCFGHKQLWKPIVGYEGLYEVSNHGNVRSLNRIIVENNTGVNRPVKGVNLSIANSKRGYRVVVLCKDGTEKTRNVHQLVAEAFIPNPDLKPCINHRDFNRLNNYSNNLNWCTYAVNNLYSVEEGKRGKTVIQMTKDGDFISEFHSIIEAESNTGVANQNITKCCKKEREFAGGYYWEYGVDKDVFPQFVPPEEETKVLEFQYGARQCISNMEEAYNQLQYCQTYFPQSGEPSAEYMIWEKGAAIYKYLCTEAKQIYATRFSYFYAGEHIACVNRERFNPINFGIDYHKDEYDAFMCFHFANGLWNFSIYNDNGHLDVSLIAKYFGGGGHKGASGFRLTTELFIDNFFKISK
jgi:oligoribonuclease NrnB/cAMP/cGMP phosphodiesterase (DHH superfamily)